MPIPDVIVKVINNYWGGGGDTTMPSPGMAPKQPLPGIRLHDLLHGRQICPEFNSFHQGVCKISPLKGLFCCPSQNEDKFVISPPPPIVERLEGVQRLTGYIMVTTRYLNTNRDQNHDQVFTRSTHPITSETFRRQDDVFRYELQLLGSGRALPVFQNSE